MADEFKLHVDSDWKAQARAEKERLAEEQAKKAQEKAAKPGVGAALGGEQGPDLAGAPPAKPDFKELVTTMATQALLYLGAMPHPSTGQLVLHLDLAAYHIDILAVIEEKTKGNLDEEEKSMLDQVLRELRQLYMERARQYADHMAKQAAGGAGAGPGAGPAGPKAGPGGLVTP